MEVSQASVVLLPCVPSSVGTARGQLRSELRACGIFPGTIGDAALVVSELLSNAILHARPLPGSRVRVSWALGPAWIELAVGDGGSETLPRAFHPSLSSIGGRGLAIVEHLCSSWGVRDDDHPGITVWAMLPAALANGHASTDRGDGYESPPRHPRLAAEPPPGAPAEPQRHDGQHGDQREHEQEMQGREKNRHQHDHDERGDKDQEELTHDS